MKVVIIEGPDNCGKNSVIASMLDLDSSAYIVHCIKPDTYDPKEAIIEQIHQYNNFIWKVKTCLEHNVTDFVIFNRSWYSDYVYGPLYRHEKMDDIKRMIYLMEQQLIDLVGKENITFIMLTSTSPVLLAENEDGKSLSVGKIDVIKHEIDEFNDLFELCDLDNKHKILVNKGDKFRDRSAIAADVKNVIK